MGTAIQQACQVRARLQCSFCSCPHAAATSCPTSDASSDRIHFLGQLRSHLEACSQCITLSCLSRLRRILKQASQLRGNFWFSLRSCPHAAAASMPLVILVLTGKPLASRALLKANTAFLLGRVKSASSTAFQGMRFTCEPLRWNLLSLSASSSACSKHTTCSSSV